ncbi:hypothetical protein FBEOM_5203 [Fusarium beomiforme]|uniref:Uncharacterized protein n=1 Tax=Fusarium beomiforme TaxID=44412 RepID=A0A9P5ALE5_9HYPO|nr:hypothetical protein FBEOM_5203 [Fusarium beomiforme]
MDLTLELNLGLFTDFMESVPRVSLVVIEDVDKNTGNDEDEQHHDATIDTDEEDSDEKVDEEYDEEDVVAYLSSIHDYVVAKHDARSIDNIPGPKMVKPSLNSRSLYPGGRKLGSSKQQDELIIQEPKKTTFIYELRAEDCAVEKYEVDVRDKKNRTRPASLILSLDIAIVSSESAGSLLNKQDRNQHSIKSTSVYKLQQIRDAWVLSASRHNIYRVLHTTEPSLASFFLGGENYDQTASQ